jgi:hypothetical protein
VSPGSSEAEHDRNRDACATGERSTPALGDGRLTPIVIGHDFAMPGSLDCQISRRHVEKP